LNTNSKYNSDFKFDEHIEKLIIGTVKYEYNDVRVKMKAMMDSTD